MSRGISTRSARKSDASEIALLVNVAVHGGMARGWAKEERASGTFDPIEVGRLEMMRDDTEFGWRSVTMAEVEGEVAGMLLGYRKSKDIEAVPADVTPFMRPIQELEAQAADHWFLSMLGVHRSWRGKGVGSVLLDTADAKAVETAARGLALIVEDTNERARSLYVRRGFLVRASRPMVRFPGGDMVAGDWLLMVKD